MASALHATEKEPIFIIKPPPGFEEVLEQERTFVDVYYLDKKIGTTLANYINHSITFEDPQGLAALVSELRDYDIVINALSQQLKQNRNLHCTIDKKDQCDYLDTDVAGVIFYPQQLKAHLFINERYIYGRDTNARYLPPPIKSPGLVISTDSRGLYNTNIDTLSGNTRVKLLAGYGRWSFNSDMYANWNNNSQLQASIINYTGIQTEFNAGLLPFTNGSSLVHSPRLLGLRYASSLKTRLDKENLSSSDVPIQIIDSAVIEVLREGRVIDVQRIDNGATYLDTRRLPSGSYNITLRINENGVTRDETRFYTRGNYLPPSGSAQWFWELGYPTQSSSLGGFAPRLNDNLQISAGISKRLSSNFGLRTLLATSELDQYAELSTFFQMSSFTAQFGYLQSADNDTGYIAQSSYRVGNLNISANYREIDAAQETGINLDATYDPFPQSYQQGNLNCTFRFQNARLGARAFYRKTRDLPESYFGGPFLDWEILRNRKSRLSFFAQSEYGSDRKSYFAGLRWNSIGQALIGNTNANVRFDEPDSTGIQTTREIIEANLTYANSQQSRFYNQINAGARHERFDNGNGYDSEFGTRAALLNRSPWAEVSFDVRDNYQGQDNILTSLVSSLVFVGGDFVLTPRQQESGVMVNIQGDDKTEFAVISNGSQRKRLVSGHTTYVPLPSYEIHDVGIRPIGSSDVEYEQHTDRIVTYPGNIPVLKRTVIKVIIAIGQIVDSNLNPLDEVELHADEFLGVTDSAGFFQIDQSTQKILKVKRDGKYLCSVYLLKNNIEINPKADYINYGQLICKP